MWNKNISRLYVFICNNILIECIICVAFIVFLLILYLDLPKGGTDNLQITISQILATIFTLVFAITIFSAQMMGTFTAMDKIIDNWTKRYMAIFSIGIILPLIQLSTDKDLFDIDFTLSIFKISTVKLSLAFDLFIATFCVFALIPYSIRVNKIMKYGGGTSKLYENASEAIDSNHIETAVSNILELTELGLNSLKDGQAHTVYIT
jgi:peptidoglycan/LPS O-acetylase OafA/YrhL